MNRLAVVGADGRMGKRVCALAQSDTRFELIAQIDRAHRDGALDQSKKDLQLQCDVVIDFSSDQGAQTSMELAMRCGAALLVGTTALSAQTTAKLDTCASSIPVMIAPNTSRGVAVLCHLIAEAARLLGSAYDIDIIDIHHNLKRDAPSGTALRLVDALRNRGGVELPDERVHSLRGGDVIGDHEVIFAGPGEQIKILHSAVSRDVFAQGALEAAAWLCKQPPASYTIEQSLGLKS